MRRRFPRRFEPGFQTSAHAGAVSIRVLLLVAGAFLVGLGVGALWVQQQAAARKAQTTQAATAGPTAGLSDATEGVLKALDSPVEMRYYAILDPASSTPALRAFADHAGRLLAEYQRDSHGHITLKDYHAFSDEALAAAQKDGVKPFNLQQGQGCYLGLAMAMGNRQESLPRLRPEWEQAFEADVTRGLLRLMTPEPAKGVPSAPPATPETLSEVKRLVPNYASLSMDDASVALRESSLKEFQDIIKATDPKIHEAQQRLAEARRGNSQAEIQDAMKHLQELQAEQSDQLKALAAKSQAEIQALKQLKSANP